MRCLFSLDLTKQPLFFHISQDPFGVAVGGTLGHCLCTGLAVIGGRMIAQKISVRTGEGLKTYLQHVGFFCSSVIMFLFFPLQLQSSEGSFFSALLCPPFSSSQMLDSIEKKRDLVFLCKYVES